MHVGAVVGLQRTLSYLLFNLVFAPAYVLCGEGALQGTTGRTSLERFADALFFSVLTSTTMGYGHQSLMGWAVNVVMSVDGMAGLLVFALATRPFHR
jgi:inward rectifier potassium channel